MKMKSVLVVIIGIFVLTACSSSQVKISIPHTFFDSKDIETIEQDIQSQVDAAIKEEKDGSITLSLSKKDHEAWIKSIASDLNKTMQEIAENDNFEAIKKLEYNKDFTSFQVYVDTNTYEDSFDSFVTLTIGINSLMYQIYKGEDTDKQKVTIQVFDHETDELFEEVVYPDVFNDSDEQ